jgi:hypothetical protein
VQRLVELRRPTLGLAAATVAYVALRLAAFLPSSTMSFPDTGTYMHVVDSGLFTGDFLAGWRGWTLPLLYKLLPDSDTARSWAQLAISIGCWLALAAVAAHCVRAGALRLAAFCLLLLFSLSGAVTQWDTLMISESLTLSLTAALFAAWLVVARSDEPRFWAIAAVLATTLLWTFVRETNAYVVLLVVPLVLAWIALGGVRRPRVVLAAGLIATFALYSLSVARPTAQPRWEAPLLDIIGTRVLTGESELDYFRARGMPVSPQLEALAGEELGTPALAPVMESPRFAPFREWARSDGRRTLTVYLVTHPDISLAPVVRAREGLFSASPSTGESEGYGTISTYRSPGTKPLLPEPLASVVYPPSVAALVAWLVLVAAAGALLALRGAATRVWAIPGCALLLQVPHAAIVWWGGLEIPRHALQVGVMTRLSLLLLTIFIVDAALEEWKRARSARSASRLSGPPPARAAS